MPVPEFATSVPRTAGSAARGPTRSTERAVSVNRPSIFLLQSISTDVGASSPVCGKPRSGLGAFGLCLEAQTIQAGSVTYRF